MKKTILAMAMFSVFFNGKAQVTDTGSNVGIGTPIPSAKLHISDKRPIVKIQNTAYEDTDNNFYGYLGGYDKSGDEIWWLGEGSSRAKQLGFFTNRAGYDLKIFNKGNGIIVKDNGNVGIGTTITPEGKLDVQGDGIFRATNNTHGLALHIRNTNKVNSFTLNGFTSKGLIKAQNGLPFEIEDSAGNTWFHGKYGGSVGIGTKTPSHNLDISNTTTVRNVGLELDASHYTGSGTSHAFMQFKTPNYKTDNTLTNGAAEIGLSNATGALYITRKTNVGVNSHGIILDKSANVGIGTTTPDSKLAVNGVIHSKEVKVDLVGWPDYVFTNDYNLPTLQEVEQHIKEKGHLANIPSAKEVEKNGVKLGEMNKKLLEKVEELTLYTIQQEKKLEKQNKEIELLKVQNKEIKELRVLLSKLIDKKK